MTSCSLSRMRPCRAFIELSYRSFDPVIGRRAAWGYERWRQDWLRCEPLPDHAVPHVHSDRQLPGRPAPVTSIEPSLLAAQNTPTTHGKTQFAERIPLGGTRICRLDVPIHFSLNQLHASKATPPRSGVD